MSKIYCTLVFKHISILKIMVESWSNVGIYLESKNDLIIL